MYQISYLVCKGYVSYRMIKEWKKHLLTGPKVSKICNLLQFFIFKSKGLIEMFILCTVSDYLHKLLTYQMSLYIK